jgi:hypothetical protein
MMLEQSCGAALNDELLPTMFEGMSEYIGEHDKINAKTLTQSFCLSRRKDPPIIAKHPRREWLESNHVADAHHSHRNPHFQ